MTDGTKLIERGPEPESQAMAEVAVTKDYEHPSLYCLWWSSDGDEFTVAGSLYQADAEAIAHRYNNWHALRGQLEAARAENERLVRVVSDCHEALRKAGYHATDAQLGR